MIVELSKQRRKREQKRIIQTYESFDWSGLLIHLFIESIQNTTKLYIDIGPIKQYIDECVDRGRILKKEDASVLLFKLCCDMKWSSLRTQ